MTERPPPNPEPLVYDPVTPDKVRARRVRRWFRWALVTALVLSFAACARWVVPQILYVKDQRALLKFQRPAESVALEGDTDRAAILQGTDGFSLFPVDGRQVGGRTHTSAAAFRLPFLSSPDWAALPPLDWARFDRKNRSAVVCAHERRTAGGLRRLVVILAWLEENPSYPGQVVYIGGWVFEPASMWPGARARLVGHFDQVRLASFARGHAFTVYAGQPDPNDESHVAIRYTMAGFEGRVDGYLSDPESWDVDYLRLGTKANCERVKFVVDEATEAYKNRDFIGAMKP